MFAVKRLLYKGFDKVLLTDDDTGSRVEIVPACGAMLHAFMVKEEKGFLNVIDSYTDKVSFDENAESEGFKGLKLSPFPCRIPNAVYSFNDQEYRLRKYIRNGSALHGLLYNQPFTITESHADEAAATLSLLYEYKADDPGYPFAYDCVVKYILKKENTLTVVTHIQNKSASQMPIADGWHPYFSFGGSVDWLELQFQSEEMLEFVNLIPSGNILPHNQFIQPALIGSTELDNSFVLNFSKPQPMCILRDPKTKWQLEISPDQTYPYLQIYIPPHRQSIAIENLSAPPDAFNNSMGLIILQPGASTDFTTSYTLKKY